MQQQRALLHTQCGPLTLIQLQQDVQLQLQLHALVARLAPLRPLIYHPFHRVTPVRV